MTDLLLDNFKMASDLNLNQALILLKYFTQNIYVFAKIWA